MKCDMVSIHDSEHIPSTTSDFRDEISDRASGQENEDPKYWSAQPEFFQFICGKGKGFGIKASKRPCYYAEEGTASV